MLVTALLKKLSRRSGAPGFAGAHCRRWPAYPFPGNVRELENILERAIGLCSGAAIEAGDLQLAPDEMGGEKPGAGQRDARRLPQPA